MPHLLKKRLRVGEKDRGGRDLSAASEDVKCALGRGCALCFHGAHKGQRFFHRHGARNHY